MRFYPLFLVAFGLRVTALNVANAQDQGVPTLTPQGLTYQQQVQVAGQRADLQNAPPQIGGGFANQQNAKKAADQTCCSVAPPPRFSISAGAYTANTEVKLKGPRNAKIFYTTDGWTPTIASALYDGPIKLTHSETIQAIAFVPGYSAGTIASADYTVSNPPTQVALGPSPKQIAANKFRLPQNAELPLVFTSKVDSESAKVGDRIALALVSDLLVDGKVLAPKGSPATARVAAVDVAKRGRVPGIVTFSLVSITMQGMEVSLTGTKTRVGSSYDGGKTAPLLPEASSPDTVAIKGDAVQILPGTAVTALVATSTDVPLKP